ncbi:sodium/solute symporter [bacterium]|nr:sodium/solute symporter [bacterium]
MKYNNTFLKFIILFSAWLLAGCELRDDRAFIAGNLEITKLDSIVPHEARVRVTLDSFPDGPISKPVSAEQSDAIYYFGGIQNGSFIRKSWCYRSTPLDGTTQQGWIKINDLPETVKNAKAVPIGQGHIMVLGNGTAWIYHTITDTWARLMVPAGFNPGDRVEKKQNHYLLIKEDAWVKKAVFKSTTGTLQTTDYLVIGIYMAFLLLIGASAGRKTKSTEAYFLGKRKIPWWAVGISLYATGTSAISFLAIPTKTYVTNQVYGLGTLWGPFFMIIAAFTIIPILRGIKITSTYEYLEARFNKAVRIFGAFISVAFQLGGRMSVVLLLPSLALSAVTGINVFYAIAIMGLLATLYTVMGGITAVIYTDVLQVAVLFGGTILAFILMIHGTEGGFSGFIDINNQYDKLKTVEWGWDLTIPVFFVFILNQLMTQAALPSDQVMVQRVLTTPTVKDARKSYILLGLIVVPGTILFHLLGSALFSYFHSNPEVLNPQMQNIQTFPLYIVEVLPQGITGLLIAALFAACMSTLDSSMNSVTTVIIRDFYPVIGRQKSDDKILMEAKTLTAIIGLAGTGIALLLATFEIKSIFDLWMEILGMVGGCFGGVFILGMFTTKANAKGAIAGAACSLVITILVKQFTDVHFMLYSTVSVLSCIIIGYLCSFFFTSENNNLKALTIYTK